MNSGGNVLIVSISEYKEQSKGLSIESFTF